MQHNLSLTPATQAVLDALRELGQGNSHELGEKSGKAKSTTDKAIKTLADAGVIVAVDTDPDAAEGTPTRWTLADGIAAQVDNNGVITDADLSHDDHGSAEEHYTDEPDTDEFDTGQAEDSQADNDNDNGGDSQPDDERHGEHNDQDGANDDEADQDITDDGQDAHEDEDDNDDDADDNGRGTGMVVQPSRPGDRKIMTIKAVLAEHGEDGATLDEIVAESGIGHPSTSRLLTAMEQADAARRLPGTPRRWIAGPTKAAEVDPNPEPPRCPLCFQVVKGLSESPEAVAQVQPLVRSDGTLHIVAQDATVHTVTLPKRTPTRTPGIATGAVRRTDLTANADGSQPFAKGELEKLTFDTLKANPGRTMTPQEIATAVGNQLGRTISSGAVRNNCGKLGAAGRIVMVSDSPWSFVYPVPTEDGDTGQADNATAEQS